MAASLRDLLATTVSSLGYEFVGSEMHGQGRGSVLRVYIDTSAGVTADDCSKVSRQVSAMLDVEDPIKGKYTLEVSSPGLDRPLFEIAHYQKVVGSRVKIRLNAPVNDQRNFVGVLLRVEDDNIHLLMETGEVVLPFSNIEKAKVIADIAG
jgi:ribosome maturation factor RimP